MYCRFHVVNKVVRCAKIVINGMRSKSFRRKSREFPVAGVLEISLLTSISLTLSKKFSLFYCIIINNFAASFLQNDITY